MKIQNKKKQKRKIISEIKNELQYVQIIIHLNENSIQDWIKWEMTETKGKDK